MPQTTAKYVAISAKKNPIATTKARLSSIFASSASPMPGASTRPLWKTREIRAVIPRTPYFVRKADGIAAQGSTFLPAHLAAAEVARGKRTVAR